MCKDVWSEFNKVYYIDYFLLFNKLVISNNWKQGNRQQSFANFLLAIKNSLQWPYRALFNCYWGTFTLYDNYYTQDFPNIMHYKNDDGTWVKYNQWQQAIMNLVFNLGFIAMDWVYLLIVWETEPEYWYRIGFVGGDIYMRYFYRNLYNVPVR